MKNLKLITLFIMALALTNCSNNKNEKSLNEQPLLAEANTEETSNNEIALFERLGGTEGITLIVDDIAAAHVQNPVIKHRFEHFLENPEQLARLKQNLVDFLSAGTGGTAHYKGKDMTSTHQGMGITGLEFVETIDDILGVLDKHSIDVESQKDVLFIMFSFRDQIIGK